MDTEKELNRYRRVLRKGGKNGISYSQCGSTWYQPQYYGSSVQYVVVNPPR